MTEQQHKDSPPPAPHTQQLCCTIPRGTLFGTPEVWGRWNNKVQSLWSFWLLALETATSSPPAAPDGCAWSPLAGVLQTAASGYSWAGHCISSCTPPPPPQVLPLSDFLFASHSKSIAHMGGITKSMCKPKERLRKDLRRHLIYTSVWSWEQP